MLIKVIKLSYQAILFELSVAFWSRLTLLTKRKYFKNRKNLKLHMACGDLYKKGWINIDVGGHYDLFLDLRNKLPFEDESVGEIFSEHFFEHLKHPDEAVAHLRECKRLLMAGGKLRIGVPDTRWPIQSYLEGDDSRWLKMARLNRWHGENCITPLDHLNYHFRQDGEHLYAYDYETLKNVLRMAGFNKISRSKFDPVTDSIERKIGTLYVNAIK